MYPTKVGDHLMVVIEEQADVTKARAALEHIPGDEAKPVIDVPSEYPHVLDPSVSRAVMKGVMIGYAGIPLIDRRYQVDPDSSS